MKRVEMTELLNRARRAFERGTWAEALSRFSAADVEQPLAPEDLERMAAAAQLVGADEVAAATWKRAHLQLLDGGEVERAVRCAFWLAYGLLILGQMARAVAGSAMRSAWWRSTDLTAWSRGFS